MKTYGSLKFHQLCTIQVIGLSDITLKTLENPQYGGHFRRVDPREPDFVVFELFGNNYDERQITLFKMIILDSSSSTYFAFTEQRPT